MDRKNLHTALGIAASGYCSRFYLVQKKSKHVHCFAGSEVSDMSGGNMYIFVFK
jgi:hypothetical protein